MAMGRLDLEIQLAAVRPEIDAARLHKPLLAIVGTTDRWSRRTRVPISIGLRLGRSCCTACPAPAISAATASIPRTTSKLCWASSPARSADRTDASDRGDQIERRREIGMPQHDRPGAKWTFRGP